MAISVGAFKIELAAMDFFFQSYNNKKKVKLWSNEVPIFSL